MKLKNNWISEFHPKKILYHKSKKIQELLWNKTESHAISITKGIHENQNNIELQVLNVLSSTGDKPIFFFMPASILFKTT